MSQGHSGWMRTLSHPVMLVGAALVVSRLLVFFAVPQRDDLGSYPMWAREYKVAQQDGVSFYEVHEREVAQERAARGPRGGNPPQGRMPSNTRRWP